MRTNQTNCQQVSCKLCEDNLELGFDFTMAFQPIIDCSAKNIFGYEALVRGPNNESAYSVISQVNDDNRYTFDQLCRVKAISLAAKLALPSILSINFLPNAIYQPERCIKTTLAAAQKYNFPVKQIMFEFTEVEQVEDTAHIKRVVEYYQSLGFITATDDFGSGYSGLNLLADFQSNIIKLDMELVRDIHLDKARQTIVSHCIAMFEELNITPLAEGIECIEEYQWLRSAGVSLMQGYLFARPGFECLPEVDFSLLN
ncbi:EAL domain-containing protein (plasmid) [Pseudoalteromonas lipolytica]|jgi:EAL domain-containing protein (putative c-di-GMP-specific phosphodiesterase class I)|uniref:EAL domain-containing protein n=1 Tax=Pseudoalteromonas lipolytica TaxID=570156 RepID=A0AAD0S3V2_9GAMM|nr:MULTISPECIES: EAL domain-containing protein [Pseudoalteromonas]AXV67332.1 EAL domain-containing protein [Pseudoalteromonas donghaensis]